jgi:hypothetical protein
MPLGTRTNRKGETNIEKKRKTNKSMNLTAYNIKCEK